MVETIKYYGGIIIKSLSKIPGIKTKFGDDYYELNLEDGRTEIIPQKMFDVCVTETPKNASDLMNERMNVLVTEIVDLLKDYNIKIQEVPYMAQKLSNTIDMVVDESDSILWKKKVEDKTFQDIDNVLKNKKISLGDMK